jgi:hypothetical protein
MKWLILVIEIKCIYGSVRTEYLSVTQVNLSFKGFNLDKKPR